MKSWLEIGRPAIVEAVNDVCDRLDQEFRAELQRGQTEPGRPTREGTIQSHVTAIDRLKEENAKLRAQLAVSTAESTTPTGSNRKSAPRSGAVPSTTSASDITVLSGDRKDWKAECERLSLRFDALEHNFRKARDALQRRKTERDEWVQHAAMLERRIRVAEEEHNIRILNLGGPHGSASSRLAARKDDAGPSPSTSFVADAEAEVGVSANPELPPLKAPVAHGEPLLFTADRPSDTTQGEPEGDSFKESPPLHAEQGGGDVRVKEEPSSDGPVVVSERAVRKRKQAVDDSDNDRPRRIKTEPDDDSSPLLPVERHRFTSRESMDLGNVAQRMPTPRKRKELENTLGLNAADGDHSAVVTPVPMYVRPDPYPQSVQPPRGPSALTPVSVNRRMVQSGGDKPRSRPRAPLDRGIASLAEDDATYGTDGSENALKAQLPAGQVVKGRLDSLLNNPTTENHLPISRQPQQRQDEERGLQGDLAIPGRRDLPFEKSLRPPKKADGPRSLDRGAGSPAPRTPGQGSSVLAHGQKRPQSTLRTKAPSELRPDDFKINPQANEGLDFAFSEVVRDKNDRAGLPGCTDMHCCGKHFRALALSQRPYPPLSRDELQEEQKLLESYLGGSCHRLASMTEDERAELWLEAKTQDLANRYGKHRHRFSRQRSPPGYWDADFPDTQELGAERAEAAKRDREKVEERYREAKRPGGRWLFRDE